MVAIPLVKTELVRVVRPDYALKSADRNEFFLFFIDWALQTSQFLENLGGYAGTHYRGKISWCYKGSYPGTAPIYCLGTSKHN